MLCYSTLSKAKDEPFLKWLAENEQAIRGGSGSYKGQRVTLASEVTRYYCACSLLVFCGRIRSAYFLKDSDEAGEAKLRSNLLTLFLGLWSIPGLVCAPLYLVRNIRGGEQITVEKVYADLKNPAQAAQRENAYRPLGPNVIMGAVVVLGLFTGLVIVSHLGKSAALNGNHSWQRQPDAADAPNSSFQKLSIGDLVTHPKFGRGKVVKIMNSNGKPIYQVQFDAAAGKRLLDPEYAKLTKLSGN
jgi:hypothetical protein